MTEIVTEVEQQESSEESLLSRLEHLERESDAARLNANRRIAMAEMKVEAVRAGMVDLDGLTFLNLTEVPLDGDGHVAGKTALLHQLKQAKPWLFGGPSSSSMSKVPPSQPPRHKLATEMTDAEYRIARKNILARSAY